MSHLVGEIVLFAGESAPRGWLLCDGSVVNISSYRSLFEVIGSTYGGNGTTTFAVPNLTGPYIICYSGCVPAETLPAWGGLPLPGGMYGGDFGGIIEGGYISIAHGMPGAPTAFIAILASSIDSYFTTLGDYDIVTAKVYAWKADGSAVTDGTTIRVFWLAI